jgi:Alr-MurF fusion protein
MKYPIEHIAAIVHGSFLGSHSNPSVEHPLLDSRKLVFPDTSLFFALQGGRRDGHAFIDELYKRGVRNFVVSRIIQASDFPDANFILVADSLKALQELAAHHRSEFGIPVIGITGSNGKTMVKEWLNQVLEDEYSIVRSPKSYNSQIGVPLSVWQMNETHELAIFEAGISQVGEMQELEKIIRPTIGIFTNIGEAHSEGFQSIREKIEEKLQLFTGSKILIYCQDQQELDRLIRIRFREDAAKGSSRIEVPIRLFSWGRKDNAVVQVLAVEKKNGRTSVSLRYNHSAFSFSIPFTDEASFENSMSSICLLLWMGKKSGKILEKMNRLSPLAMRLELKEGIHNCSVINDSYSADLSSLKIALDFLSQQHQHEKKTVILSDFLQSGRKEEELYQELAILLRQSQVSRLIGVGGRISAYASLFKNALGGEAVFYPSSENLIHDIEQIAFRNETILLKGARIFEFERIDRLLSQQVHQTLLEIDLNAMAHNLKQYQSRLKPSTQLMVMVKAFAYGSGTFQIANLLQFHRVDWLAVAYADEGVELRRAGIRLPIMVMNPEDSSFEALIQYQLEPVIYSIGQFRAMDHFLKSQAILQLPVHLELETGLNRLGIPLPELEELLAALNSSGCKVQSVFTHLAASEEPQHDAFTHQQASLYLAAADRIQHALKYPFLRHISNSAAIIRHPQYQLDMVRLGIGLYGIDPATSQALELEEVSTLKSTISQIREVREGETVGYDRNGTVNGIATIATVRIGYADGYPRSLGNGKGKMWLNGKWVPTLGSICMDMTMIDITGVEGVKENDEVIVFGKELSVRELARWAQTIPYEILTGISQRVKRIYFEE